MGKFANQEIYRQFDRQMDRGLDEAMDGKPAPLTEAEKAAQWDHAHWERLDREVRFFGGGR